MIKNLKWLFLVSLTFVACNEDDEVIQYNTSDGLPPTAGTANFAKYVALGDSFAAGFSDNALFIEGQKGAYPNILAQQFALVGGGEFKTPFMADNVGGFQGSAIFTPRLYFNGTAPTSVALPPLNQVSSTTFTPLGGTFNNLGIPGAKATHLDFSGYASANPYYGRIASSASATILDDAIAQSPTFFTLWIGGNDVLGYATTGGDGTNPITPSATFNVVYNDLATQLSAGGRKGAVANLPYVSTLPFFTTVPFNPLSNSVLGQGNEAVGVATVNALNAQLYGPLKGALTALGQGNRINLLSTTAANPLLIKDEDLTNLTPQLLAVFQGPPFNFSAQQAGLFATAFGQARQTTSSDYVLLSTRGAIGVAPTATDSGLGFAPPSPLDKFGITFPLQDKHILIPSEQLEIINATDAYNVTIENAANANGLAFFDAKKVMEDLISPSGISGNGFTLRSTFVTGGAFSLDGVHPSPRGYALIANKFLEAINAEYGSNFKGVNYGAYRILFPAVLP